MQIPFLSIVLLALAIILFAAWLWTQKKCSEQIESRVTEILCFRPGRQGRKGRSFVPVYTFTYRGVVYNVSPIEKSWNNRWNEGDPVTLYIDPKKPSRFRTKNDRSDLIYAGASAAVGILFIIISLVSGN